MKKVILAIAVLFTLASNNVFAQEAWTDRQNELSYSVSYLSIPTFAETLGMVFGAAFSLGNQSYDNMYCIGVFNVEYYRKLNKTFAVGGGLTYEHWTGDILKKVDEEMVKDGRHNSHYLTPMVGAKAFWFERDHVSMYSKLVGGATGYTNENMGCEVTWAFQATPVGISFGGQGVRGFAEIGVGTQGVFLLGLTHRF